MKEISKNLQTSRKIADLNITVRKALVTLGLSSEQFQKILQENFNINFLSEKYNNLAHAPAIDVFNIFKTLCLNELFFYMDYNREYHIKSVCDLIDKRQYKFKRSKIIKKAWEDYKNERWQYENNYLRFRLRWKMRLKRIFLLLIPREVFLDDRKILLLGHFKNCYRLILF